MNSGKLLVNSNFFLVNSNLLKKNYNNYKPPKNPIVLCHGFSGFDKILLLPSLPFIADKLSNRFENKIHKISDDLTKNNIYFHYWRGIKEILEANGSKVITASVPPFDSIEDRAKKLNNSIENYIDNDPYFEKYKNSDKSPGQLKFNLIAHSMGGLDSRYLISKIDKKRYGISSLTTISTPHHGSEFADFLSNLLQTYKIPQQVVPPSLSQLTTSYLNEQFNKSVVNDPSVSYYSYGAQFTPTYRNLFNIPWRVVNKAAGDNDGLVCILQIVRLEMAETSEFLIRPIEREDKDQWVQLWSGKTDSYLTFYQKSVPPDVTDYTFERFLDESVTMWCAVAVSKKTNKVIGFISYLTHLSTWSPTTYMYINDLYVSEKNRLGGVGRKLFEYTYKQADLKNCTKVYWSTQLNNHRAQLLYTKVGTFEGYVRYSRNPDYEFES
ncbi:alpha/beta-hydrolase [Ascoidea rubescens DSM 1968]|uniref:Alpha/beta-hydrolase n=1 Tax=Ascoidea rubescens DSM 1968 TaxID=1344418 RepID=A0A1D2VD31_9ASCO|nr:alpha/beta-hydrolase [Ascoidea rubescens DSM 1968]ODV59482.1 alpha/beta-hydrolase [Ascoidea rubescens DSM 1968]